MKTTICNGRRPVFKFMLAIPLALGLNLAVKAQQPPPPGNAPQPPPSPKELFNKINPFKKNKTAPVPPAPVKSKSAVKAPEAPAGDGPPPPPNPLDLFKKKKATAKKGS